MSATISSTPALSLSYRLLPGGRIAVQGKSLSQGQGGEQAAPETSGTTETTGAPGSGSAPGRKPPPSLFEGPMCLFLPAILLLMYFMMIRPQQKQEKARRQMLSELKKGDNVVTSGGIHGQVVSLGEATVTVKFGSDPGQRFKMDRSGINRVLPRGESGDGAS